MSGLSVGSGISFGVSAPYNYTVVPLANNGLKNLTATGSITSGTNSLVLTSNPGFAVNDYLIVEIGAEPGAGQPGTMGVGGAWPPTSYATEAALLADHSLPNGGYAWALDTGNTWQWNPFGSGTWITQAATPTSGNPYYQKGAPQSLLAKITGVSGNTLTLDTNASATATNANVYFDNTRVINLLIDGNGNNISYVFPPGTFCFGAGVFNTAPATTSAIYVNGKTNIEITGAGKGITTIKFPRGCSCTGISYFQSPYGTVRDLTFQGNYYLDWGWGMNIAFTSIVNGVATRFPNFNPDCAIFTLSNYCIMSDVDFQFPARACATAFCAFNNWYRLTTTTDGALCYTQWLYHIADSSTNCYSYDCDIQSTYLKSGHACRTSNYCGHIRPTGKNIIMTLNACIGCVLDTPHITITTNSQLSDTAFNTNNPIMQITQTTLTSDHGANNRILNMNILQQGYVNARNESLQGVGTGGPQFGLTVSGGTFSAPDWHTGVSATRPVAVRSDPDTIGAVVENLTCVGLPDPFWGNINVANGTIHNCTVPSPGGVIKCPGPNCQII